jgi:hypothetical protein
VENHSDGWEIMLKNRIIIASCEYFPMEGTDELTKDLTLKVW